MEEFLLYNWMHSVYEESTCALVGVGEGRQLFDNLLWIL